MSNSVTPWTIVHGILQARILEWVAFYFSRGSSKPRDWTQVSCIADRFFTSWSTRQSHIVTSWTRTWTLAVFHKTWYLPLMFMGFRKKVKMEAPYYISRCLIVISQFSSVAQPCLSLCNPMNRSMPGLPVHHQLLEFTQTHVHRVGDAIQPSHPLLSPSPQL